MKKRIFAVLLAAVMAVGVLAGCGAEKKEESSAAPASSAASSQAASSAASEEAPAGPAEVTYPYDTDVTLRVYIGGGQPLSSGQTDYKDVPFWKGLIENTGINCEWEYPVAGSDATAAYNLMLTEEELPHIVIGYYTNASNMAELVEDGVALNLNDYYEQYAPDYYEMIIASEDEYAVRNRKLASVDGTIPAFISVRSTPWGCTYVGPLVRQDWLDNLGLETPKTIKDVEDVLVAFQEEYDAFFTSPQTTFFIQAVGAFAGRNTNYFIDEDGVVQYANAQTEWKDWLTLMNKWYTMGILDPNFATCDSAYNAQLALEEKTGLGYSAISQQTKWRTEAAAAGLEADWVGFAYPTNEAGDVNKWIQTEYSTYTGKFGAYVTNACDTEEELAAAMAWLNWAYTEEGQMYWNFGTEGDSYEMVDGKATFTDKMWKDERGIAQALRDYTGASAMPVGVQLEEFVRAKNDPACGDSVDLWVTNQVAADYIVPGLPHTAEENATITDLNTALNTYVTEMAIKFITGQESLDNFDAFLGQLDKMNLAEVLKIKNDAYQRFLGN